MKRALFCPPTYFEIRDVKNPYMTGAQTIDRDLARQQWEALTQAFRDAGCQVETIEPVLRRQSSLRWPFSKIWKIYRAQSYAVSLACPRGSVLRRVVSL